MSSVSGKVNFGEAGETVSDIRRRQYGSRSIVWWPVILLGVAAVVGLIYVWDHIAWGQFWDRIPWIDPWGDRWVDRAAQIVFRLISNALWVAFICVWIGALLCLRLEKRMKVRFLRKALQERGTALPLPISLTITADAFVYDEDGVLTTAKWPNVSEVLSSHDFWVFFVALDPIIVPKRFFLDENAERGFIAEALTHMTEAARTRSKKAVKFVGAGVV